MQVSAQDGEEDISAAFDAFNNDDEDEEVKEVNGNRDEPNFAEFQKKDVFGGPEYARQKTQL